jgi:tetratricopeptide (TPR) repeat protein
VALIGACLVGCADAITTSRTETNHGRILLAEGEPEEAAQIFANQVRRSPRDYKAHYYLGESRATSGRYEEAISSYGAALEVMPLTLSGQDDDEYRFKIVDSFSQVLADHDPDGTQLAQVEQKGKGNKTYKLLAAMTHARAGRPDNAIESFNEAFALDRSDPQVAKQYGLYLQSIAQSDAAEYYLRRAYRLNTRDEEVAAALMREGIVPGPALLSSTELSKPALPLGPLPEVKFNKEPATSPDGQAQPEGQTEARSGRTLN